LIPLGDQLPKPPQGAEIVQNSKTSLLSSLLSGNAPTGAGCAGRGRLISNFEVATSGPIP
jgi:hypothetical protein